MNNLAVETLLAKRKQLMVERDKMTEKFNNEIADIDKPRPKIKSNGY